MKQYKVFALKTDYFSGTLYEDDLSYALNSFAEKGWRFVRSIHEEKKTFLFFKREVHLLIFEKDQDHPAPSLEEIQ